jgi:uncharacterized membrane protein
MRLYCDWRVDCRRRAGRHLLQAFTLEIGFFLFFLPYTMFYNWAYDNLREKFLKRRQQRRALAG